MKTEPRFLFSSVVLGLLIVSMMIIPAYANVQSVRTDKQYYVGDAKIVFTGVVEDEDTGFVTLVINDPDGEFVLLSQAYPNGDNTFEITVSTESKFLSQGTYNATAFVVNMTDGSSVVFDYYFNEASVPSSLKNPKPQPVVTEENSSTPSDNNSAVQEDYSHVKDDSDSSELEQPNTKDDEETTPSVVYPDPQKDPQYYINRYNSEPLYREWFDKNFPGQTIYESVGIEEPVESEKTVLVDEPSTEDVQKKPMTKNKSEEPSDYIETDITQVLFALGGIGVLFGAVYGIKRKVDSNAHQIIKNRQQIERNVSLPPNEPIDILKTRLARGEIDLRQYNRIRSALESG